MLKQVSQLADPERCVAAANSLWIQASRSVEMQTEIGKTQAIDYAIEHKIKIVEAGAQGEHKLQRGYVPTKTWSSHWIKDREFSRAIEGFLDKEVKIIDNEKQNLEVLSPYKN